MNRGVPGRLHGDDLIGEVLRNMEEGLFRIRRKTIVPAIYRIYLSPHDYEPFRDVVPFVAGEIRAALDEQLARWNGSKRHRAKGLLEKIGVGEAAGARGRALVSRRSTSARAARSCAATLASACLASRAESWAKTALEALLTRHRRDRAHQSIVRNGILRTARRVRQKMQSYGGVTGGRSRSRSSLTADR